MQLPHRLHLVAARNPPYNASDASRQHLRPQPPASSLQPPAFPLSYRTFKRVLGESNLERKCRLLFGMCMLLLVTGSFWWYGSETDEIVYDLNRFIGKALVNSAMLDAHKSVFDRTTDAGIAMRDQDVNESLADLLPQPRLQVGSRSTRTIPTDSRSPEDFEWDWMREWDELRQDARRPTQAIERGDRAIARTDNAWAATMPGGDRSTYIYYQPVFAKRDVHRLPRRRRASNPYPTGLEGRRPDGRRPRRDGHQGHAGRRRARNRSLLITLGIVTVFLAMAAL